MLVPYGHRCLQYGGGHCAMQTAVIFFSSLFFLFLASFESPQALQSWCSMHKKEARRREQKEWVQHRFPSDICPSTTCLLGPVNWHRIVIRSTALLSLWTRWSPLRLCQKWTRTVLPDREKDISISILFVYWYISLSYCLSACVCV